MAAENMLRSVARRGERRNGVQLKETSTGLTGTALDADRSQSVSRSGQLVRGYLEFKCAFSSAFNIGDSDAGTCVALRSIHKLCGLLVLARGRHEVELPRREARRLNCGDSV